jgi:hypothetical protein
MVIIKCVDGDFEPALEAKAVLYIKKSNLPVAFLPIATVRQVLAAYAMQARIGPGISFHIYAALAQTAAESTETGADLKRRWRELRFLDTESLVEYFDRAQDLAILLQERGITYDSEDIAMDVLHIRHWHSLSAAHWSTCAGEPGTYTESCRRLLRRKFRSRLSNEHVGKNPCVGWIQGLIQESTSPYCSPLLVVPKPDGSP